MNKVYLYVVLTAFCFGTLEISGKIAGNNVDAFQLTFWRFLIGSLCLLPIAITEFKRIKPNVTKKDVSLVVLAGIVCVPISLLICQLGIERCNASTASVILATNGMFTMVFAHFIANEKFTAQKAKLLFVAIVGLIFLICPWNMKEGNTFLGVTLMLIGAITFALYVVMGKIIGQKIGSIVQACSCMFIGSIILLIIILIMDKPIFEGLWDNIIVVLYAGVVVTCGGYLFLFLAIRNSNASTGAIAFFLKIVIAPLLSVIILKETLEWNSYVGISLVLLSSFLNLKLAKKPIDKLS